MLGGIEQDMSQLAQDLSTYADEAWNKQDILAGLKLIGALAGIGGTISFGVSIFASGIPFLQSIGIPITSAIASKLLIQAFKQYDNLNSEEREFVRKTVRFLRQAFGIMT
jgi:hypothetical protein